MRKILTRYQNRRALLTTHMDLGIREKPRTQEGFISDPKGRMEWSKIHRERGNTPLQMWDKLYRKHANLGFVFSGDQSRVTAFRLSLPGDHGTRVHALRPSPARAPVFGRLRDVVRRTAGTFRNRCHRQPATSGSPGQSLNNGGR